MTPLELLAPARDLSTAREAILHGADAVYIGAPSHGARSKATNSLEDIRELVKFATPFGVKVYVTVNTIIYDNELESVRRMVWDLYRAGVDALIVQDMALLEMDLPPIALHASTQMDTRTPEKARFLESIGFSQIVVAREMDLEQLRAICSSVSVPVEAFVHGALCVSYSGDCQASFVNNGRSANRGNCAQMCRLPYDLIDGRGNVILRRKHLLSLRDLNRIESLAAMADCGVSSFKIEGRLKDAAYVKNVVAAYRRRLDEIIAANPEKYFRPSRGVTQLTFTPSLEKAFNRGYTDYFFTRPGKASLATFDSPKAIGELVATVRASRGKILEIAPAKSGVPLVNGDGLTYITSDGHSGGFRVNRVEGARLHLVDAENIAPGTKLFRSFERRWEQALEKPTAERLIPLDLTLSYRNGKLLLEAMIEGIGTVVAAAEVEYQQASKPDNGYREKTVTKFGNTIFSINSFTDRLPDMFVPASILTNLRRQLVDALMHTLAANRNIERRKPKNPDCEVTRPTCWPEKVTRHDNVANDLAARFYESRGVKVEAPAIEVSKQTKTSDLRVMTTRYCLRRELGACLKEPTGKNLVGPLYLRGTDTNLKYRLDFDCANCQMHLLANPTTK